MFIAVGDSPLALRKSEAHKLVYKFIGVSRDGYLGDFSYNKHQQFYLDLELDHIDPMSMSGSTRERFTEILLSNPPDIQARILQGILDRYPVGSSELRTPEMVAEIQGWISRLRGAAPVAAPTPRFTSEVVARALDDAEHLLGKQGAVSAVDRAHTALHGHLREVCAREQIPTSADAAMTELFKALREQHPAFRDLGPRADDIGKVLRALSTILDTLNPLRNRASVAHPNDALLPQAEAMLVLNAARSVLRYVDDKLKDYLAADDLPF